MTNEKQFDIGIVTTVWGDYGKYLPEWASSVCQQTVKPKIVTLVVAGETPNNAPKIWREKCVPLFNEKEIAYQIKILPEHKGMGYARNAAVRETKTKWIMHLDVDDLLLPFAIYELSILSKDADVIVPGVRKETMSGELIYEKIFTNKKLPSLERISKGKGSGSSMNTYRRSFWEKQPYIEENEFVVTSLLIGFLHLGARVKATDKACCIWRFREDSHWHFDLSSKKRIAAKEQNIKLIASLDNFKELR